MSRRIFADCHLFILDQYVFRFGHWCAREYVNKSFMLIWIVCHRLLVFPDARSGSCEPKAFHQIARHISVNIFALLFKYALSASRLHPKIGIAQNNTLGVFNDPAAVPDGQALLTQVIIYLNTHHTLPPLKL